MYVVINELEVPAEAKEQIQERFGASAEKMNQVPGCLEFLFLDEATEDGKQLVFTKWETKEDFENWLESDSFKSSHRAGGQEKRESAATGNQIRQFRVVHAN